VERDMSASSEKAMPVNSKMKRNWPGQHTYFFPPRIPSFAALATRNLTTVLAVVPFGRASGTSTNTSSPTFGSTFKPVPVSDLMFSDLLDYGPLFCNLKLSVKRRSRRSL
jgi:hypothetical protein